MPPLHGLERKGTWPYLSLPVVTKTGSRNLDAPYLARQRCRGKSASSNTYGDGAPSRFGGGRRRHEEQIEATHAQTILPSFGPHGCVKPYCCLSDCTGFLLESARCYSKLEAGHGWMSTGFLPPLYVRMGLLL